MVMYRLSPHCLAHKGQEHRTQPRLAPSPWERGAHRRSTVPTTTATVVLVLTLALVGSSPINRPSDVQRS